MIGYCSKHDRNLTQLTGNCQLLSVMNLLVCVMYVGMRWTSTSKPQSSIKKSFQCLSDRFLNHFSKIIIFKFHQKFMNLSYITVMT